MERNKVEHYKTEQNETEQNETPVSQILVMDFERARIISNSSSDPLSQVSLNKTVSEVVPFAKIIETATENDFISLLKKTHWDLVILEAYCFPKTLIEVINCHLAALNNCQSILIVENEFHQDLSDNMSGITNKHIVTSRQEAIEILLLIQKNNQAHSEIEELKMMKAIADSSVNAIITCDLDGMIIYHNESAGQLFFQKSKNLVNTGIDKLLCGFIYPIKSNEFSEIKNSSDWLQYENLKIEAVFFRENNSSALLSLSFHKVNDLEMPYYIIKIKDISYRINQRENLKFKAKLSLLQSKIECLAINELSNRELYLSIVKIIDDDRFMTGQRQSILMVEDKNEKVDIVSKDDNFHRGQSVYKNELGCFYSMSHSIQPYITTHDFKYLYRGISNGNYFCIVPLVSGNESIGFILIPLIKFRELNGAEIKLLHSLAQAVVSIIVPYRENNKLIKLQKAVEECPLSIIMTSNEGIIEYVNHFTRKISGYKNEELIGQHTRIFQSGFTPNSVYDDLWTTLSKGESWTGELQNKKRNGEIYWEKCFIGPVADTRNNTSGFIALKQDITQERKRTEELKYLFTRDAVTGLPNRNVFMDRLALALENNSEKNSVVIISLNIVNFKYINNYLGYSRGNVLLKEIGNILKNNLMAGDSIARINGTGFHLIFTNIGFESEARSRLKKLIDLFIEPITIFDMTTKIDFHCGAAFSPSHSTSSEELLLLAESGRQAAKLNNNPNSFEFAIFSDAHSPINAINIVAEISRAIKNEEFILYYQIQVNVQQDKMNACEALIRWNHPKLGLLSPDAFVPLLEQSGLVIQVGKWVIEAAFKQLAIWSHTIKELPTVAINISSKQISSQNFLILLDEMLNKYPVNPRNLQFELTETSILSNPETSITLLRQVKKMGFSLAIDDFGTGYSNLGYLKDLPVEKIKIDRCFIRDITSNAEDALLSKLIIQISHTLDFEVVAEGVETEAQLNLLTKLKCDIIQGYYFSKPVPSDEFEKLISNFKWTKPAYLNEEILLIVDDEAAVLNSLKRLFRKTAIKVMAASSPVEALEIMAMNNVAVVMSDMMMEGISGIEFLSRISKIYPQTVRIMLTGSIGIDGLSEALNKGAIHKLYLKPWDDDELKNAVREAFKQSKATDTKSLL